MDSVFSWVDIAPYVRKEKQAKEAPAAQGKWGGRALEMNLGFWPILIVCGLTPEPQGEILLQWGWMCVPMATCSWAIVTFSSLTWLSPLDRGSARAETVSHSLPFPAPSTASGPEETHSTNVPFKCAKTRDRQMSTFSKWRRVKFGNYKYLSLMVVPPPPKKIWK